MPFPQAWVNQAPCRLPLHSLSFLLLLPLLLLENRQLLLELSDLGLLRCGLRRRRSWCAAAAAAPRPVGLVELTAVLPWLGALERQVTVCPAVVAWAPLPSPPLPLRWRRGLRLPGSDGAAQSLYCRPLVCTWGQTQLL